MHINQNITFVWFNRTFLILFPQSILRSNLVLIRFSSFIKSNIGRLYLRLSCTNSLLILRQIIITMMVFKKNALTSNSEQEYTRSRYMMSSRFSYYTFHEKKHQNTLQYEHVYIILWILARTSRLPCSIADLLWKRHLRFVHYTSRTNACPGY